MATHLTILSLDVSEVKCDSCPPSPHGNNGCDVYPFSDISDEESSPYTLDDDVLSWCHPDRAINVDGLKLYCQSAERSFFHRLVTGTVDVTDPMMCLEHNDDPSVMAVFERVVLLIANVYQCTTITQDRKSVV